MKIIIKYDELYGALFTEKKIIKINNTTSLEKINRLFAKFKIGTKYFIIKKDSENNENDHKDSNGSYDHRNSDILEIFEVSKLYKKDIPIDLHLTQLDLQNFNNDLNKDYNNNEKDLKIEKATQIKLDNIAIISINNSDNSLSIDCKILKENENSVLINTNRVYIKKTEKTGKFEYQGDSTIFLSNIVNNNQKKELMVSKDGTTKIIFDEINLIEQEEITEEAEIADASDEILE